MTAIQAFRGDITAQALENVEVLFFVRVTIYANHNIGKESPVSKASQTTGKNTESSQQERKISG